jgi:hypothetical protein
LTCVDGANGDGSCQSPTSCADVLALSPGATDGNYVLFHESDPSKAWDAYCHDMTGAAAEYLTLTPPNFFEDRSQNWQNPKFVTFSRIRIDPVSLVVNVSDLTFAVRTGDLTGYDPPYASAGACKANHGQGQLGTGTIDLRGTPFFVDDTFDNLGYCSSTPIANFSENDQVVALVGDGQCGWTAPVSRAAFYGDACWGIPGDPLSDPDWALHLAFLP